MHNVYFRQLSEPQSLVQVEFFVSQPENHLFSRNIVCLISSQGLVIPR